MMMIGVSTVETRGGGVYLLVSQFLDIIVSRNRTYWNLWICMIGQLGVGIKMKLTKLTVSQTHSSGSSRVPEHRGSGRL